MTDKAELRKLVREKIRNLDSGYIKESDAKIYSFVSSMMEFAGAQTVFAYNSIGREVDTRRIIDLALELDKKVALPVVLGSGKMEFAVIDSLDADMEAGSLGIPQPRSDAERLEPGVGDLLLVPALCFDYAAYRLGQGGGYYDRLLASCPAYSVGLGRHQLLMKEVPREVHDLPAKCLITENGIIKRYRERQASHQHEHDCNHEQEQDCDGNCAECSL